MEIFLFSVILLALAFTGLGVRIFFLKDGKFPETEAGRNKNLRKLGINCPKNEEWRNWRKIHKKRINPEKLKIDVDSYMEARLH